jgi:hypothetical protein
MSMLNWEPKSKMTTVSGRLRAAPVASLSSASIVGVEVETASLGVVASSRELHYGDGGDVESVARAKEAGQRVMSKHESG